MLLGYAGLLPFIGLTVALFLVDEEFLSYTQFAFQAYGAVILTFIGGVHWGLVLRNESDAHRNKEIIASIVPSLFAWISLLLPVDLALGVLLTAFLLLFFYEYRVLWADLFPAWYRQLRCVLTTIVCLLILINLVKVQ